MHKDILENPLSTVKTRSGSKVVIFSVMAGGNKPMLGAYLSDNEWIPCKWTATGSYIAPDETGNSPSVSLDLFTESEKDSA